MKALYFTDKKPPMILKKALGFSAQTMSSLSPTLFVKVSKKTFMNPFSRREYEFQQIKPEVLSAETKAGRIKIFHFPGGSKNILLTHGWADTSKSFETIIQMLLKENYSVWAFDHIGHGRSEGKFSNLFAYIDGLKTSIEFIESQGNHLYSLISHSMGGAAILNLTTEVLADKKIILMAPPTYFFEEMFKTFSRVGISESSLSVLLEHFSKEYQQNWKELKPMNNKEKIQENFLFIHDTEDIFCSYTNMLELIKGTQAQLETSTGLGHRKILRNENTLMVIKDFLS